MAATSYFGGCEGGASHTVLVIVDSSGNILGEAEGEGTNQWLIGLDECCKRIEELTRKAKIAAGLQPDAPLKSLGLSLSGADDLAKQNEISSALLTKYPNTAEHCHTCNDTLSPLVTASSGGGVVLIAGTGSNCLLANPSGMTVNCGGWGHILGDQGSAYWIVLEALRCVYQDADGFERSPHKTCFLKKAMFEFFGMNDMFGILPHLYPSNSKELDKHFIAKFCLEGVVKGAREGDKLSLHILSTAGNNLGKHVKALIPKMENELLVENGGLKIICVGSVWKSWEYLKEGFLSGLSPQTDEEKRLKEISLLKLKNNARPAVGAAAWAARKDQLDISIDYSKMSEEFFHYKFSN